MTAADVVAREVKPIRRGGGAPCPKCGWTPSPTTRGGPVHIGVVLADIVHRADRCMNELLAAASASDGDRR